MNERVLLALKTANQMFPSLRVGQLILNAIPEDKLYYITDEEFATAIWDYLKGWGKK